MNEQKIRDVIDDMYAHDNGQARAWANVLGVALAEEGEARPVLYVHPMLLEVPTLAVECSFVRLVPQQIGLYREPPAHPVSRLYEQLRAAIDGGSESMTHEDALREVERWREMDSKPAQPASVPDETKLREIARLCASTYGQEHDYTPAPTDETWQAHDWVIEAMKAACRAAMLKSKING